MYHAYGMYPYHHLMTEPCYYHMYQYPCHPKMPGYTGDFEKIQLKDYGPQPLIVDIDEASKQNKNFRTTLWTGNHLQLTLMSIPVGGEIGLEMHPDVDQFIRIEAGHGLVKMGEKKNNLIFQKRVYDDFAFIIPAGTWHNLVNTGNRPIKLYSIYAPPQHPQGTVHSTMAEAEAAEEKHGCSCQSELELFRQTRELTSSELSQFDGTMGNPAYVAVNGIVYDVSSIANWSEGTHYDLTAGKDLTLEFESCHGLQENLDKLPKVGVLKE